MTVTFITGNVNKAAFLAKWLGHPLDHVKLDLDEIQSLDPLEITRHKAIQAFEHIKGPVLVEDAALSFHAMGKLPGPYVKWFLQEIGAEGLCRILDAYEDRSATNRVVFCLYDGVSFKYFEGVHEGKVPLEPRGTGGFGYDPVFIPEDSDRTYAEMSDDELGTFGLRTSRIYPQIRKYLKQLEKAESKGEADPEAAGNLAKLAD